MRRQASSHTRGVAFWLAVAVVVAVAAFGASAIAFQDPDPTTLLNVLDRDQTPSDALPSDEGFDVDDFDVGSARLLFESADTSIWVVVDTSNNVCLVGRLTGPEEEDWEIGTGCAPSALFAESGVRLEIVLLGDGVDASLMPDGRLTDGSVAEIETSGGQLLDPNLILFEIGERPESLPVETEEGDIFDLGVNP